ncbi:hypothetical protein DACRYDRAFT_115412 [Dacryopinax primogenitus]|uniref:Ubiquitin-like domain-containing protein n=1 Tax=Dacryopinax primogenitus (strain DJM 731) TaxID=1858805 RepID=M5GB04_DACPD|nr:uncharacterized protein DACRYDRAFT_115412 [Dacryopinax primogenitus]EJU03172.1 hypothetical protein DACRYDRAFT_115412 [Dacryopinax primogenitus]
MPPRPRPRRVAHIPSPTKPTRAATEDSDVVEIDAPSFSPSKSPAAARATSFQSLAQDDDEDDFFDRSNTRKLQALTKRAAQTPESLGDVVPPESPPSSGEKKRKRGGAKSDLHLPKWTQGGKRVDPERSENTPVLTISSSDNDSSDAEIRVVGGPSTPRPPARAKTLTPPPQIAPDQLARVRQAARDIIAASSRVHPGEREDEVTIVHPPGLEDLDPELAAIAKRARENSRSRRMGRLSQSQDGGESQASESRGGSVLQGPDSVALNVRIYPLDWAGEADDGKCHALRFKVKRNAPFRQAFELICERSEMLMPQLIVTHEHKQVWASATPHSLGIWDEATLEAYSRTVHERVEAQRLAHRGSLEPSTEALDPQPDASGDDPSPSVQTIHLNLLAAGAEKGLRIACRPTTAVARLVRGFLSKYSIENREARLSFEGEDLDPEGVVGDYDLEDGDQLEVRLL